MTSRHNLARNSPIFVDGSGRRRRWVTAVGAAVGTGLVAGTGVLVAGLLGAGPGHLPGLPAQGPQRPQGAGAATAGPTAAPSPTESSGTLPTTTPTAKPAGTPSPTASLRPRGRTSDAPSHPVRPTKSR